MHRAFSWNSDWFRIYAIASDHLANVRGGRRRNELPICAAQRPTGLDAILAATRFVDGSRETIHGVLAVRDFALSSLRARRSTRTRRRDLGELLSARHRDRLLDERRVHRADCIRVETSRRARAHARA